MNKILLLLGLLRRGNALTDPEVLHDKDKLILALTGLFTFAGNAAPQFGIDLGWLTPENTNLLAGGAAAVWIGVQHYISSPKRGILPAKDVPQQPAPVSESDRQAP